MMYAENMKMRAEITISAILGYIGFLAIIITLCAFAVG